MASIPIQGLAKEDINPYEAIVLDMNNVSIENGQFRNRRTDSIIANNLDTNIQAFAFPPNTSNPATQRIPLDTPHFTYWRDKLLACRLENSEPIIHAYHVNDLAGKKFYPLEAPTIDKIERIFDVQSIHSAVVGAVDDNNPPALPYDTTRQAFYRNDISVSQIRNYQATFYFVDPNTQNTVDLSAYNSLMIQEIHIEGNTELDWGTIVFTLITRDNIEVLCDFTTWGSRSGSMFFDNDNVSYATLTAYQLEIDISSVPRSEIRGLRISWIAGKNQGNFPGTRNWSILVKFYPSDTNAQNRHVRLNGQFGTGLQSWASVISSRHTNTLYQELLTRSTLSRVLFQIVGLGTKWTSSAFTVTASSKNIQWQDILSSDREYHLVIARSEGNQWIENHEQPMFVLGKSRSTITSGISNAPNITVALSHNVFTNREIGTEGSAVLYNTSTQVFEVVRYRQNGSSANQIVITQRGTNAQSFPVNSPIFFLTYYIQLRRETISRSLAAGGNWFYGLMTMLDNRVVMANPLTGEIAVSTINAPLIFPASPLRVGDGFRVYLGDLPFAMQPANQGVLVYTLGYTYRIMLGENERSTVLQKYHTPKPRSSTSTSYDFFVAKSGVFQGNQLFFEANYSEPASNKPSAIAFDGHTLYWSYDSKLYIASPKNRSVIKYDLGASILWIEVFDEAVFCLLNRGTYREIVRVEGGATRVTNGWIQYGKMAKPNLFRIKRIAIWGNRFRFTYTTPLGSTTRELNTQGMLSIDTTQPNNRLTHEVSFQIDLTHQDSVVSKIEIELEESPAARTNATQ